MRRRTASISIVALVLVLVVLGGVAIALAGRDETKPAGSSTDAPITILWIGDTTGPVKAYGEAQLAGVKGAADYFNEHGGIAGRRVVVDAVSDNGDPAIAASALTRKLAEGEPTMVWAGSTSVDGSAMIPILARNEVFSVALTDGGHCEVNADVVCPHHWTLSVPNSVAPQTAVNWIDAQQFTKAGILEPTTSYSAEVTQGFETSASAAGISVDIASFPPTAVDLAPQMQELKQNGAQVVFAEGIGSAQYAFAARAALRWDVPVAVRPVRERSGPHQVDGTREPRRLLPCHLVRTGRIGLPTEPRHHGPIRQQTRRRHHHAFERHRHRVGRRGCPERGGTPGRWVDRRRGPGPGDARVAGD
jgi:hypothetical protein